MVVFSITSVVIVLIICKTVHSIKAKSISAKKIVDIEQLRSLETPEAAKLRGDILAATISATPMHKDARKAAEAALERYRGYK